MLVSAAVLYLCCAILTGGTGQQSLIGTVIDGEQKFQVGTDVSLSENGIAC